MIMSVIVKNMTKLIVIKRNITKVMSYILFFQAAVSRFFFA